MNQSVVEGGEEVHGRPKLSLQKRSDALQSAPALAPTSTKTSKVCISSFLSSLFLNWPCFLHSIPFLTRFLSLFVFIVSVVTAFLPSKAYRFLFINNLLLSLHENLTAFPPPKLAAYKEFVVLPLKRNTFPSLKPLNRTRTSVSMHIKTWLSKD